MQMIDQRQLRRGYREMASKRYQECEDARLNKPDKKVYCARGGRLQGEYTDLCYYWVMQASRWQRQGIAPYSVNSCPKSKRPPTTKPTGRERIEELAKDRERLKRAVGLYKKWTMDADKQFELGEFYAYDNVLMWLEDPKACESAIRNAEDALNLPPSAEDIDA